MRINEGLAVRREQTESCWNDKHFLVGIAGRRAVIPSGQGEKVFDEVEIYIRAVVARLAAAGVSA